MTLRATAPCPIGCGNRVDLDEILCGTIGGCLNIEGLPDGDNRLLAGAGAIDCDDDDGDSLPDDDGDGSCGNRVDSDEILCGTIGGCLDIGRVPGGGNRLLASGGAIDCDDGVDFDKVTCGIMIMVMVMVLVVIVLILTRYLVALLEVYQVVVVVLMILRKPVLAFWRNFFHLALRKPVLACWRNFFQVALT